MNAENQFHYSGDPSFPPSHPPFRDEGDNVYGCRTYYPSNLSFLGPPPSSHDQAMQDFNVWNRSTQGSFPSQPLQGSGQAGSPPPPPPDLSLPPTSRKRKRTTSPTDPASAGGCGSTPGTDKESNHSIVDPSHTIKFIGRRNSAYEIWAFARAIKTDDIISAEQWPNDYDDHLVKRPRTSFLGCKLCTEFGKNGNSKEWRVFENGPQTSPTSTLRSHFQHNHDSIWDSECSRLNVPRHKSCTGRPVSDQNVEPFTQEGLVMRLQKFIVGDDQSINVIENAHFRELLLYLGQGHVTDDEIPKRTHLTECIIKAWKMEREQFYEEMKRSLGRVSLTADAWSTPNLMSFFGTTAHFIVRDKPGGQLILRSGLLAFRHLQGSHTGKHLADVLYEIIKTAGIEQKIGLITADNASNNDTMMEHLEGCFAKDNIPFDRYENRVRCFPHVINLAVQAIYAALKDGKGIEEQYLLGRLGHINEAAIEAMTLPHGVTKEGYLRALTEDVLGTARKLVAACRISGKRREEFLDTILKGNLDETWLDDDGTPIPRKTLQLLRDCETRWSSTYFMVDRVMVMLPVIEAFSERPNLLDANLPIPNAVEVCVLDHIRSVMSVPHDAQESLSSDHTPTLSYSLPFYHSIIDEWDYLKGVYPLLSPFIDIGINKVEAYINKSKLSQIYLLAILLNPCLKIRWIEKNCSVDDVQRARQAALDAMLAFKKEELDVERGDASAYTDTPTHSIKAVAASARRFLDRTATRTSLLAQHADAALPCSPPYTSASEHDAVLNGLRFELDSYLHEPRAEPFKRVTQDSGSCHIIWCDPLRYWTGAERRFPYLFRLAMDVLPAQASAVPCERLFSSSKETCTPRRNRINPDLMEALQILKFSFRSNSLDLTKHVEDNLYAPD